MIKIKKQRKIDKTSWNPITCRKTKYTDTNFLKILVKKSLNFKHLVLRKPSRQKANRVPTKFF